MANFFNPNMAGLRVILYYFKKFLQRNFLKGRGENDLIRIVRRLFETDKISPRQFLILIFLLKRKRILNLKRPLTFSEKLQWLKLYDHKELYTLIADKVTFKLWVTEKIGAEYVIPTFGIWDKPEEIDFGILPEKFVIKCNHSSGNNYIHREKAKINKSLVLNTINSNWNYQYYYRGAEWPYKNIKRKILAEKYIEDVSGDSLPDYKFYCFNGRPIYVQINSYGNHYRFNIPYKVKSYQLFYNMRWERQNFAHGYPKMGEFEIDCPTNFDKMKEIAAKLSKDIPFVRVDLYNINGIIYVGELTFYPYNGFARFKPNGKWDRILGELLVLPIEKQQKGS